MEASKDTVNQRQVFCTFMKSGDKDWGASLGGVSVDGGHFPFVLKIRQSNEGSKNRTRKMSCGEKQAAPHGSFRSWEPKLPCSGGGVKEKFHGDSAPLRVLPSGTETLGKGTETLLQKGVGEVLWQKDVDQTVLQKGVGQAPCHNEGEAVFQHEEKSPWFFKVGIIVGKKVGNAVIRQKIKRRLRCIFQEISWDFGGQEAPPHFPVACLIIVRKSPQDSLAECTFSLLKTNIRNLFHRGLVQLKRRSTRMTSRMASSMPSPLMTKENGIMEKG